MLSPIVSVGFIHITLVLRIVVIPLIFLDVLSLVNIAVLCFRQVGNSFLKTLVKLYLKHVYYMSRSIHLQSSTLFVFTQVLFL